MNITLFLIFRLELGAIIYVNKGDIYYCHSNHYLFLEVAFAVSTTMTRLSNYYFCNYYILYIDTMKVVFLVAFLHRQ